MTGGPTLDLSERTMFAIRCSEKQDRSLRPSLARPVCWEAL
jgi:hypothetical protein